MSDEEADSIYLALFTEIGTYEQVLEVRIKQGTRLISLAPGSNTTALGRSSAYSEWIVPPLA
jgi:hypothetical protein